MWHKISLFSMHRLIKSRIKSLFKNNYGWSGDYTSWDQAGKNVAGYNANNILEKVKDAVLKVKHGEAVYERDSVIFDKTEYSYPLLSALLWICLKNSGRLNVIDFGGSLGSSYFQNRKFLAALKELRWHIIEQPNFVNCGRSVIQDDILTFHHTIDEVVQHKKADILLMSCVIQYIEKPYELIRQLIQLNIPYILVDNTPFNYESRDRITIQKVHPAIYTASYPCWFLDYEAFKKAFSTKYLLINEHLNDSIIELDGRKIQYKGFLMELKNTSDADH